METDIDPPPAMTGVMSAALVTVTVGVLAVKSSFAPLGTPVSIPVAAVAKILGVTHRENSRHVSGKSRRHKDFRSEQNRPRRYGHR